MDIPIDIDQSSRQSLQGQVFDQVRGLILSGRVKPGTPLPPTRTLSEQLGVSRNTVLLAYERLLAEGYLQTRKAVGTFVSSEFPEDSLALINARSPEGKEQERQPTRKPIPFRGRAQAVVNQHRLAFDFWVGRPDPHSFPTKTWRRLVNRTLVTAGSKLTEYRDPGGLYELRKAIADHLGPARGISTTPEQVIIIAGSQEGLNVAARLLVREGTPVATESPCYQGAAFVFESYRVKLVPVPVDEHGIVVDKLPKKGPRLLYVTPSHQYPMGYTLSLERRLRLLEWAWRAGAYIIEDDYDSDFRYSGSPLTALTGLDNHGCVIYLGTFSKSIGAGLRLGYLVVPRELVGLARTVKALLNNGHPWLEQAILAQFITGGSYATHLRRIRQMYRERRDCVVESLQKHFGKVMLSGLDGGMHVTWHLPGDFPRAIEVQRLAEERNVGIYSLEGGAAYDYGGTVYSDCAIMLGYSSLSEKQIEQGIERVAAAVGHACRARRAVVAAVDQTVSTGHSQSPARTP